MHPNSDLIDLLAALNGEGAGLIARGYAFTVHGRVRGTKDVDVFIGIEAGNARKVGQALVAFGAPLDDLRPEDLARSNLFFIVGRPPNQIDIITTIDGVSFEDAWRNRYDATYADVAIHDIGRDDLIAKTAADRPQDRADVAYLRDVDSGES